MPFNLVLGQDLAGQIIKRTLKNGNVAHAYLFYGPESIGKKLSAIEFAKALNCPVAGPEDNCGSCSSCRKIDQRIHPDFFLVEPTKTSSTAKEAAIRIDEIRELQKKLGMQPYEGKTKVAIIDGAELMNLQAANSFLKTLEEPSAATVLILIAANLHQMLPTIISRCQKIKFSALTAPSIQKILRSLEEMEPEELELRSAHSRGQVIRALEYDITQSNQYRQDLLKLIEAVSFDRAELVFEWTRTWSKQPDKITAVLEQLMGLLRDLAFTKAHANPSHLYNKDLDNLLKPLSAKKTLHDILNMFDSVQQAKYALLGNANTQLTLENMLLRFCDAA